MTYSWYDFIGNIGVIFILVAYLFLQLRKLSTDDLCYSLLNFLGALLILVSLVFDFNLSAFIIELMWVFISVIGLIKSRKVSNKNKAKLMD